MLAQWLRDRDAGQAGAGWLRESRAHDTMAGSRRMKLVWMRITAAGRKAITY
jgi:hypothetical protein